MKNLALEKRFLSTTGRINRKIFILYAISFCLFSLVLIIPTLFIVFSINNDRNIDLIITIVSTLLELALLPSLFLSVKRLHDVEKSAVWIILYVVPIINIGLFLYLCCVKGTVGENKYGEDPLNLNL